MSDGRTTNKIPSFYQFLDRETREIRLLYLESSTEWSSPICCQLKQVSIQDPTNLSTSSPFEALSYTWGKPAGGGEDISINDESFPVTSNLAAFLRQRRETHRTITLWVDAVCINQADNEEKNYQVGMMRLIYTFASSLRIWLGPASEDSDLAMQHVRHLGTASPYHKMPPLGEGQIGHIRRLFQRPWWSRVWIVQELVLGGAFNKVNQTQVQCGTEVLEWRVLVIAAARFKAHEADQREVFPAVVTILELESLRENALYHMTTSAYDTRAFDLLCRFRHFSATNPRDKVYALYDIFIAPSENGRHGIPLQYEADVREVYVRFALGLMFSDIGLEMLRHCGPNRLRIPSWVPDWSTSLSCEPLPVRKIPRYFDVPWWSEPVETEPHGGYSRWEERLSPEVTYATRVIHQDPKIAHRQRVIRLNRLKIAAAGGGVVEHLDEVPHGFTFNETRGQIKSILEQLLRSRSMMLIIQDERCMKESPEINHGGPTNPLRHGEIITERRTKSWLVRELQHLDPDSNSAMPPQPDITSFSINTTMKTLDLKGISWDIVETCHDGFVSNVTDDWWNATRFMVAVGCCKKLAVNSKSAQQRYSSADELLESFWLTLFAGQTKHFETSFNEQKSQRLRFAQWLPEVPQTWTLAPPRVCVSNTGSVRVAENSFHLHQASKVMKNRHPQLGAFKLTSSFNFEASFIPADCTDSEKTRLEADSRYLATLWQQQPYDLYHRPFELPHIVPDPYWKSREHTDGLALRLMQEEVCPFIVGPASPHPGSTYMGNLVATEMERSWRSMPSILPPGTLDSRMEQFALGRTFFITKKGYFGLGPKSTEPGDQIIVVPGSRVPFVIRRDLTENSRQTWKLIGETYVHGIMNGEVIAQSKTHGTKTETFPLV